MPTLLPRAHNPVSAGCLINRFQRIASFADLSDTSTEDGTFGSPTTEDFVTRGTRSTARSWHTHDGVGMLAYSIATVDRLAAR